MTEERLSVEVAMDTIPFCVDTLCIPTAGSLRTNEDVSYNFTLPTIASFRKIPEGNFTLLEETSALATVNTFLQRYVTPVIIFTGVLGNLASLAVFQTSRLRRQTSSLHLSALALSDTGFLLTLLISWLAWFQVPLVHKQPWCVLVVYLTYVCSFLSVWIVVTFTVERFIVACFPLQRKRMVRTRRASAVLGTLTLGALLAYSFATWMTGVVPIGDREMCVFYPQYQRALSIIAHVDMAVTFVIPMLTIITLNSAIAVAIYKAQRSVNRNMGGNQSKGYRTKLMSGEASPTPLSQGEPPTEPLTSTASRKGLGRRSTSRSRHLVVSLRTSAHCGGGHKDRMSLQRRHMRSTRMLLVVSTVFVLLNLPAHALKFRTAVLSITQPSWRPSVSEGLWQHGAELLYYVNFAINFFLYSLCGQNFRRCLTASCVKVKTRAVNLLGRSSQEELHAGRCVDATVGPALQSFRGKRSMRSGVDATTDWSSNSQ